jgi:hypothetical protein
VRVRSRVIAPHAHFLDFTRTELMIDVPYSYGYALPMCSDFRLLYRVPTRITVRESWGCDTAICLVPACKRKLSHLGDVLGLLGSLQSSALEPADAVCAEHVAALGEHAP